MAARPALLRTVGDRWRPVAAVWLWTVCGLPERRDSEERAAMRAMRKESPGVRRYGFPSVRRALRDSVARAQPTRGFFARKNWWAATALTHATAARAA